MLNDLKQRFADKDAINLSEISPGFIQISINNRYASATISLYGGQLLEFKPHDQNESLIWLSDRAVYQPGKAIRGGIPLCWPWFGAYEADNFPAETIPAHGYARISHWLLDALQTRADGQTELLMHLPEANIPEQLHAVRDFFHCQLSMRIVIGRQLTMELSSHNYGEKTIPLSYALHSYFNVSDIHDIELNGMEQQTYLDKLNAGQSVVQSSALRFTGETDRIFIDSDSDIRLVDSGFKRTLVMSKKNSRSTIVWNPWQATAAKMSDMTEPGWLSMVCVEAANVNKNQILLAPGTTQRMQMVIKVE